MNATSSTATGAVEGLANKADLPVWLMEIFARRNINIRLGKLAAQKPQKTAWAQLLNLMEVRAGGRPDSFR